MTKVWNLGDDIGATDAARWENSIQKPTAAYLTYHVSPNGDDTNTGLSETDAVKTLAKALDLIGANEGVIQMGVGVIDAGAGVSLSGKKCTLRGHGSATKVTATTTQSGPVIDFTGYTPGTSATTRRIIGDFAIYGDGVADPTNTNKGVNFDTGAVGGVAGTTIRNITVQNTGGSCFDLGQCELSSFEHLVATTPVGAAANDIPYVVGHGACNSNHFINCGLRSLDAGVNVGASGAVVIGDDGSNAPYGNHLDTWWAEFLHVPTGGTIFHIKGWGNRISHPVFSDCGKGSGATGTSFIWLDNAATSNNGANVVEGDIPGSTSVDVGVRVSQSRNRIVGTKGYDGSNVQLDAGVDYTFAELGGQRSGTTTDNAFIDNSGTTTNVLIDHSAKVHRYGTYIQKVGSSGGNGPRFTASNGNGAVFFGDVGARIQNTAGELYHTLGTAGLVHHFRDSAGNDAVTIRTDKPSVKLASIGSLPAAASSYRGAIACVQGGTGVADQFYLCRKKADESYEWVQITT